MNLLLRNSQKQTGCLVQVFASWNIFHKQIKCSHQGTLGLPVSSRDDDNYHLSGISRANTQRIQFLALNALRGFSVGYCDCTLVCEFQYLRVTHVDNNNNNNIIIESYLAGGFGALVQH